MPTIVKGSDHMQAVLYTGTGATQTISGLNFQPDLVWIKSRSAATDHKLTDAVRGVTKALVSNSTAAETTDTTGITAFTSTGFTLGANSTYNNSGATYVAWCWKAGNTTSSNTNGSITSTVSVNASAGFSVVTYTANGTTGTIGHGLGVTPQFIVVKARSSAQRWTVFHVSTSNAYIYLNETFAAETANAANRFGNNSAVVQPTSSVFTIGSSTDVNSSGNTYVAYCWTPIAGYSAFGSYTGNGSTDGTFVYTGFQPKWVMIKRTDSGNNWFILDTARNTYNLSNAQLLPNSSAAESTNTDCNIDILSNGFKLRTALDASNGSGGTYIYAAFAANPFKNSLAR